jgi:PAS domain S-box-containing protein
LAGNSAVVVMAQNAAPANVAESRAREATGMSSNAGPQSLDQDPEAQQAAVHLQAVFEATTDGMLVIGALPGRRQFTIVDVNRALSAMTGFSRDDLIGMNPLRLVLTIDRRRATGGAAIRSQERFAATVAAVRKDGSTFDAELQASPLHYRGLQHYLVVVRDVSERVQAFRLLEQRVAERTHELETLLAVAQSVASTLELPALLALVLDQLKAVVDHDGAAIMLREGDEIVIVETRDYRSDEPHANPDMTGLRFPADRAGQIWEALSRRESVIINDVRGDEPLAREYRSTVGAALTTTFGGVRSYLAIPLASRERVFGFVRLSWTRPHAFTPRHAELATAFATQVAIAFENARLFDIAQQQAAVGERQRLARELHDSVTQSLFSITLFARAAEIGLTQAGIDPDGTIGRSIGQLRVLTQGALAEMRALIFQLRPDALTEEGLVAALQRQAAALTARQGLPIAVEGPAERLTLPPHVEEHLYRLALEALHNAINHAGAARAWVRISAEPELVMVEIGDDGRGFDSTVPHPGHLGLTTMAERAARSGGNLTIDSAPGQGTRVRVALPYHRAPAVVLAHPDHEMEPPS